jgi:cyclohexyl-isocyanide hydratase
MAGLKTAQEFQLQIEYAPDPPFDAGVPETAPPDVVAAVRARGLATRQAREALVQRVAARL